MFAVMSRTIKLSLFCCVFVLTHVSTDAYGLSLQVGTKSIIKDANQASVAKKDLTNSAPIVQNNENTKDISFIKKQPRGLSLQVGTKSIIKDANQASVAKKDLKHSAPVVQNNEITKDISFIKKQPRGLSPQVGTKSIIKDANQASVAKKDLKQSAPVVQNNEITKDSSFIKKQPPKMVTLKQENKLIFEIEELKRMHQQLTQERTKDPNNERKLKLLQHIEKQIKIRQLQKQRNNRITPLYNKQVTTARKVQQFFTPRQSLAATHFNAGLNHSDFQTNSQQHVTQQKMQQNIIPQKQESQHFKFNSQVQLQTLANDNLWQQSNQQQSNIASTNTILLPHNAQQAVYRQVFMRRGPVTINTHQLNGNVAHQIPSQHTGILVPVSALSSHRIRNGQGLLQNRIVLLNPMFSDKTLHVVSNGGKSIVSSTPQLPKSPPTSTKTTTPSTTITTESTTILMQFSTSTSDQESTTTVDKETLQHDLLQRKMKKHELAIRKLRQEIQALQREEGSNLPEIENEDGPQQRPGQF